MSATEELPRSLRVCALNPCYWPEVQRGSERIVREVAHHLIARGHSARLVAGHPGPPTRKVEDGLVVWRMPRLLDRYLAGRQVQEYITHLPWTYLALRAGSDDLAWASFPTDACAALRWREVSGKPVVFSYNGLPNREVFAARRGRLKVLTRAIYGADELVVLSQTAAAAMERWFGRRPRVIYPGVDVDSFKLGDGRAEAPTIVCAAPWEDGRKRVPLLVEAFKRVRRERRDATLCLVKPHDPAVRRDLERQGGVELVDWHPDTERMARLYRRGWVSALTSYNEAFGLVLCEAMACGTPVVAENLGGPREIVTDPAVGRLFDGDEPDAVARALLEALELAKAPGTPEACRNAAARFSSQRCGAEHESLFLELTGAGP